MTQLERTQLYERIATVLANRVLTPKELKAEQNRTKTNALENFTINSIGHGDIHIQKTNGVYKIESTEHPSVLKYIDADQEWDTPYSMLNWYEQKLGALYVNNEYWTC